MVYGCRDSKTTPCPSSTHKSLSHEFAPCRVSQIIVSSSPLQRLRAGRTGQRRAAPSCHRFCEREKFFGQIRSISG